MLRRVIFRRCVAVPVAAPAVAATINAATLTAKPQDAAAMIKPSSSSTSSTGHYSTAVVGMAVSAFTETVSSDPIATGRITAKIGENVFAVTFDNVTANTPVMEVGSRVVMMSPPSNHIPPTFVGGFGGGGGGGGRGGGGGQPAGLPGGVGGGADAQRRPCSGIIAKAQGNGTFAILLDDNTYYPSVPRDDVLSSEGRPKFTSTEKFARFLAWVQDTGVARRSDAHSASCVLFQRGWRVDTIHLLEPQDVHCISHLNKSVRMSILDGAEADKDRRRTLRELRKETLKERHWKFFIPKYSSTVSSVVAFFGVLSVFSWNLLNYKKTRRPYQLDLAIETLAHSAQTSIEGGKLGPDKQAGTTVVDGAIFTTGDATSMGDTTSVGAFDGVHPISRQETQRLKSIVAKLDSGHPRLLIVTGLTGAGKSLATRAAIEACGLKSVSVEIRGKDKDDPIRAIAKSLGVNNIEVCGDLFEFVADACSLARVKLGSLPVIVLKLKEANMGHVYDDAITLACDRRVCHIIIELDVDMLQKASLTLPRTDYVHVSNFTPLEALAYSGHTVDAMGLLDFAEEISTNSMDIDELISEMTKANTNARGGPSDGISDASSDVAAVALLPTVSSRDVIRRKLEREYATMKGESHEVQIALAAMANRGLDDGVPTLKALTSVRAVPSSLGLPPVAPPGDDEEDPHLGDAARAAGAAMPEGGHVASSGSSESIIAKLWRWIGGSAGSSSPAKRRGSKRGSKDKALSLCHPTGTISEQGMHSLRAYCMYHCEKKAWVFKSQMYHTCASMLKHHLLLSADAHNGGHTNERVA